MSVTAEHVVELFEKDARARKRLAELLMSEPDVRLAIINAVLRDVATKRDVAELRRELREDMAKLEAGLSRDIDRLYRLMIVAVLGILVSIATTVLARLLVS